MTQSTLDLVLRATKKGTGVSEASKELGALDDQAKATGDTLGKVGEVAGGLLKAGITAAAAAAVKAVNDTAAYNREVRLLAQSINATTEETSRLVQVADDVGVSQDALTRAMQLASKNGFAPTIDNIAKLADETRGLTDPTEKAAALSKVFGRGWAELVPLLDMGGNAIKENAAAVSDSLIVTAKASKATREYEIAQDNLGDAVDGMARQFGNLAIPALTEFFNTLKDGVETLDLLVNWQNKIVQVQTEHELLVRTTSGSYQEYITEIVRANGASAEQELILRDVERGLLTAAEGADLVAQASGAMTQSQFEASRGAYGVAGALDESNRAATRAADAARNAASANDEEANAFDRAKFAADLHAQSIAQNATIAAANQQAIANYADTVGTLAQKLKDSTEAQAKQELAQAGIDALKEARDNQIITNEQYNTSLNTLMITYGLANEKSIAMGEGQATLNQLLKDGVIDADTYVKSIGNIPAAARDGQTTLDELVKNGIDPAKLALLDAGTATGTLKNALDMLPRKIKIEIALEQIGNVPSLPGGSKSGRAGGGPVAQGVPVNVNELFNERFVPYAAGSMMPSSGNTSYQTTIASGAVVINPPAGVNAREIAQAVMAELGRQTNQLIAAGAGGMGV